MNHSAAEEYCVSQGGHLASVGSKTEQEEIEQVGYGTNVWLGGRRVADKAGWQWLDNRAWVYQNGEILPSTNPGNCLYQNYLGNWYARNCADSNSFICASPDPPHMKSGNHTMVLEKDLLKSPEFYFWWNHNPDSRGNKMPGFKLSWHVKNGSLPDVREFVSKKLSGSVSTPGLGSLPPPDYYKEEHEYTAVIELPHNITAMVVDIDVTIPDNQRESGVEALMAGNPKLEYNSKSMNWTSAEAFCMSKGGHLASVTSPHSLYKLHTFIAEKDIRESHLWLGGTDLEEEGNWRWSDGSKWSTWMDNWGPAQPNGGTDQGCLQARCDDGLEWSDKSCGDELSSICKLSTYMENDIQLMFTGKNLSQPALQFKWASEAISHEELNGGNNKMIGGFILRWDVSESNSTEDNGHIKEEQTWKQKYDPVENNRNVLTLMKMVRESKVKNVDEKDVWKSLLRNRWSSEIIRNSPCLTEEQEFNVILKTTRELNLDFGVSRCVPGEDLAFGKELYSVVKCPFHVSEAAKLSQFFEHLLSSNNSLNTVLASTLRNTQPMAGNNLKDFTAINMWYERLDTRYSLSLGPVILPMLTTDNLTLLAKLDPPYLKDFKASIGENNLSTFRLMKSTSYDFRRELIPSEPPTSPDFHLEFGIHPILCLQDRSEHLQELSCSARFDLSSLLCFPPNNP